MWHLSNVLQIIKKKHLFLRECLFMSHIISSYVYMHSINKQNIILQNTYLMGMALCH